jgi:hypothetical protein
MKRLFYRIANFFRFVKTDPKLKKETDWQEIDQKYFSKEAPLSYTNSNDFEEDGLPTKYVVEKNKVVLSSRVQTEIGQQVQKATPKQPENKKKEPLFPISEMLENSRNELVEVKEWEMSLGGSSEKPKKIKPNLPKNANLKQLLNEKYNNKETVYRDNKGRFASLKK